MKYTVFTTKNALSLNNAIFCLIFYIIEIENVNSYQPCLVD